jgi:hypothetical protein
MFMGHSAKVMGHSAKVMDLNVKGHDEPNVSILCAIENTSFYQENQHICTHSLEFQ